MDELTITDGLIKAPGGVIGYTDYGHDYIYVCYYQHNLVVAEYDSLDSVLTRLVRQRIMDTYYYAFKIICARGVTAVCKWIEDDVVLIGVTAGHYETGERIWTSAADIKSWPGLREE